MGADEVIDYKTQRFEEVCKGQPFDCVVDSVGGRLPHSIADALPAGNELLLPTGQKWWC